MSAPFQSISTRLVQPLIAQCWMRMADLPPLKWSSLKYDFRMEDKIDGKEEAYG
ncbi:Uncharacterised protein [Afipia felis]|uniref:Uncharacterized protein n=2 Tax=Afipia felis TaxID=1035 RepID=A0A380W4H3_AFIFE|nr:hypothetical protein HMPREF9697_02812 [Afipia felis ATCC 53690]SUU75029.1 Uncharacterised protein [Afipia felis]SUU83095.1 Uncharacterised protein [Afipia felis]